MATPLRWLLPATLLLSAAVARADVPPPDECGRAGSSCKNAGNSYDQPGTCQKSTCSRPSPDGNNHVYECNRCVAGGSGPTKGCAVARGTDAPLPLAPIFAGVVLAAALRRRARVTHAQERCA